MLKSIFFQGVKVLSLQFAALHLVGALALFWAGRTAPLVVQVINAIKGILAVLSRKS